MIAGLPVAMTPLRPYRDASDDLKFGVFKALRAADCHAMARFLGIDYLFIGVPERRDYRPAVIAMRSDPARFEIAFENAVVTVFRVVPIGPSLPPPHMPKAIDR
jgi:hypothetical protein